MLRDYLKDYGLSSDQINYICKYYGSEDSLLDSEDFEIAAISGLSIEEARRLKEFIATKRHGGVARDFLRRWSRILSDEDLESAYREYEKLAKLHPESPVIWQIKGELLEKMGRHAEAMEAYRRAKELYEKRNEIPPSVLEEKLHGATYHHRTQTNGIGLINGLGFSNGKSRSHVNGFSNGFKNGIINGSGLVNGTGRIGGERRGQTPPIIRFLIAMVIIFVVVYSPLISLFFFQGAPAYSIDGNFDEWRSAVPYYSLKSAPGDIDITVVKFHPTERGLYFFIQSRSRIFQNASGYYIFIDGDMDSNTGYLVDNIGAEYMVEIYGWNGSIVGRSLYLFNSTDNYDFSGFTNIGDVAAASRGNMLEGFIPHRFYNFRSVVVSSDYAGGSDVVDVPKYGSTPIYIREKSYSTIVHFNETEPVLKLEFFSQTNFTLDNITFKFNGTATPVDMNRIALYLDDGDNVFDSHDTMISDSWGLKDGWKIIFPKLDLNLKNKSTIFLTVRCQWNYLMERSIFVSVVNLGVNLDYVIVDLSDGGSYIGRIPDEVHVDGSFMDWQHTKSDPVMDVRDPAGHYTMGDYNIDITNYSSYNGDHLYFYLAVNGELFGGSACPVERSYRLPDSDGDSVPDRFDIYPYDFNNDGVPDDESVIIINGTRYPDVDGDGIPDYPYGEDMWLNTTIPSNFPAPYGGKEVHRYIGPIPFRKIDGNDTFYVFIDDNGTYHAPFLPFGTSHMVVITGRGGNGSAWLKEYRGNKWIKIRKVKIAFNRNQLEGDSVIHGGIFVLSTDWMENRDLVNSPAYGTFTVLKVDSIPKLITRAGDETYVNMTLYWNGSMEFGNLTLINCTVRVNGTLELTVYGNFYMDKKTIITANGTGYEGGKGGSAKGNPDGKDGSGIGGGKGGMATGGGGGGGGYGGYGGDGGTSKGGEGGKPYGTPSEEDIEMGSGGGGGAVGKLGSRYYDGGNGASGGGCIKVYGRKIIIEGGIYANGENAVLSLGGGGGGGSGGGILIYGKRIFVNGTLSASGGNGGSSILGGGGGGGAGGRIKIFYTEKLEINGNINVSAGKGGKNIVNSANNGKPGDKGTEYYTKIPEITPHLGIFITMLIMIIAALSDVRGYKRSIRNGDR